MSTKAQLADLLTKALIAARFKLLYSNLQLQELPFRLRGVLEQTKQKILKLPNLKLLQIILRPLPTEAA